MAQARPPVTTVASRTDLGSYHYWTESSERRAQRFYVLICLALSSIHDRFLGASENHRRNCNWSATISYYGIVHAARFICFQVFGTFPTAHNKLGDLFGGSFHGPFDWLAKFNGRPENPQRVTNARAMLTTYWDQTLHLTDTDARITRLAEILGRAKNLRNDSNYEALLIAHQRDHVLVEGCVKELADHMERAAIEVGDLLADAIVAEVDYGADIPDAERPSYRHLALDYLQIRGRDALRPRSLTNDLRIEFEQYFCRFALEGPRAPYDDLEQAIMLRAFGGLFDTKQGLMTRYQNDIQEFGRVVQQGRAAQVNAEGEA